MLELIRAGGWPMIPLLLLSAIALAIIVERFWSLRRDKVLPPGLGDEVRLWVGRGKALDPAHVDSLRSTAPLGALLAAALDVRNRSREEIRDDGRDGGRGPINPPGRSSRVSTSSSPTSVAWIAPPCACRRAGSSPTITAPENVHSPQTTKLPTIAPRWLPLPPTISIAQIWNVTTGRKSPGLIAPT